MGFNWMFYTFTATIFLSIVLIDGQRISAKEVADIYKLFEEALLTNEENLVILQDTFFDPSISESATSVSIRVRFCKGFGRICAFSCESVEFEWVSPRLSSIINSQCALSLLYGMEPATTAALLRSRYGVSLRSSSICLRRNITQNYTVDSNDASRYALSVLISWAKVYASKGKAITERKESDQGVVLFKCERIDGLTDYFLNFTRNIIFSSFAMLNIFLLGVTLTFFPKFFKWLYHTTDDIKSLYFSLSVVAILWNVGSFIADVVYTTDFIESDYPLNDFKTYIAVRYTLTAIIIILDVATTPIYINHEMMDEKNDSEDTERDRVATLKRRSWIKIACCIMKNENTERDRVATRIKIVCYSISSCNILWSTHRLASALIVFATNIPVVPAASIGTLALVLLATIGCVLAIFFFLKNLKSHCNSGNDNSGPSSAPNGDNPDSSDNDNSCWKKLKSHCNSGNDNSGTSSAPNGDNPDSSDNDNSCWKKLKSHCNSGNDNSGPSAVCNIITTCARGLVLFIGVAVILLMLSYLLILWDGARSSGTEEFLLAVLPLIALTVIGWIVDKKFQCFSNVLCAKPQQLPGTSA